jgi:hypothetical protein
VWSGFDPVEELSERLRRRADQREAEKAKNAINKKG